MPTWWRYSRTRDPMNGRGRPHCVEVAALTIVILAGVGLRLLYVHHEVIVFPDEGSYLELAANLRDGRGFVTDWKWYHWNRAITHPEDTRQPGLPMLIAGVEKALPRGHDRAAGQAVAFTAGIAVIVAAWAYGRALFGIGAGLVAALLVAIEPRMAEFSSQAMTEMPAALGVLGVALLLQGRRAPSPVRLVAAGSLLSLTYLARANASWLLVALLAALAFGPPPQRRWHWALPFVAFLVVASPWLIRNQLEFGQPLHYLPSTNYFVDGPSDTLVLRSSPPSLDEYRRTHTLRQVAERVRRGLVVGGRQWVGQERWPLFALAVVGVVLASRRPLVFALVSVIVGFAGVLWLTVMQPIDRFSYPFLPLVAVLAAGGCATLATRVRYGGLTAVVAVVACCAILGAQAGRDLGRREDLVYESKLRAMTDAAARISRGTVLAERYGFPWLGNREWQYHRPTILLSLAIPLDPALAWARQLGARYLIVPDDFRGAPGEQHAVEALPLAARGPGWQLHRLDTVP